MLSFIILVFIIFLIYVLIKFRVNFFDAFLVLAFSISLLFFEYGLISYQQDYFELADGFSTNYTPFASAHSGTFFTFLILSLIALVILWIKQRALPPLFLITIVSMILIGAVINVAIILQVIEIKEYDGFLFYLLPFTYLITAFVLIVRLLLTEAALSVGRNYKHPALNQLNNLMAKAQWQPFWILLLTIPLFLLVMLMLVMFGQDPHAITKVFTETTTWNFSTKSHPPLIDHKGHYLCTVAACGDPAIVKPIGWGYRHGYPIIVNRQLQVANAFEELIQENLPGLHRIIRNTYDRYGYPVSKQITSPRGSNITYWVMKPLEYFFLVILYLSCISPEQKIAKQYLR